MRVTARQLNRATLARQLLLSREPLAVPDAVRRVVAIQAQEPASPYIALWNRIEAFDPAELDRAFVEGTVVKATLMRMTLHAVHRDEYPAFHGAIAPFLRSARLRDDRFTVAGLSAADLDELMPSFLSYMAEPRTARDVEAMLEERHGPRKEQIWFALRTYAPLVHVPTGGPWSFGAPRRTFRVGPATQRAFERDEALGRLIVRYLSGFGPASVADVATFARIARSGVRTAIDGLARQLVRLEGPNGEALYDVPGGTIPAEDVPTPPRLMAMWDSTLLAYADRARIIPPDYRAFVIRSNGDVLPTLLVDGHVAGVWRPSDGGIEVTAFHKLTDAAWAGLEDEARALTAFLASRQPTVYGRYARWWNALPGAESRVLGG